MLHSANSLPPCALRVCVLFASAHAIPTFSVFLIRTEPYRPCHHRRLHQAHSHPLPSDFGGHPSRPPAHAGQPAASRARTRQADGNCAARNRRRQSGTRSPHARAVVTPCERGETCEQPFHPLLAPPRLPRPLPLTPAWCRGRLTSRR